MSLKGTCNMIMLPTLGFARYKCAVVASSVDNVALLTHVNP